VSKTVLITGANRGIGLEFVRLYKKQGAEVLALCRNSSDELDATGAKVYEGLDVSVAESVSKLPEIISHSHIDCLINNAGILRDERLGQLNFSTIQSQFEVNALGPLRVTEALLPKLGQGAKVALITSRMGSIADNSSGGRYGYRMSKAALNAAGMSLARDLLRRGDISPEVSAQRLAQRIEELNLENSGTFWHSNGEVLPW